MKAVFTPEGKWYAESNFSQFKPGHKYEYSNEGSNLAALIVEVIAGIPFHQFTQENIFKPLQMNNTSWFYGSLDSTFSKIYVLTTKRPFRNYMNFLDIVNQIIPAGI